MTERTDAGAAEPGEPRGGPSDGVRKGIALAALAVAVAAGVGGTLFVRRAVQRMPALSPTDSAIVAGGRPGTPGAAAPAPIRPPLRQTPPPAPGRGGARPGEGRQPSYPRLQ